MLQCPFLVHIVSLHQQQKCPETICHGVQVSACEASDGAPIAVAHQQETIAVTQNYVSSAGLSAVLAFLKTGRADLVSGCAEDERADLHDRFVAALRQQRPQVSTRAS